MGGFRLSDDKAPRRSGLRQCGGFGNAVTPRICEDEIGRIGKARRLRLEARGREGHERRGEMPGYGLHGGLFGAHVQRRDESNALRIGDDGKRQIEEFSGGRAALAAEADDKRSSSGLGEWGLSAHGGLSKIPRERPGLAVSDGSG